MKITFNDATLPKAGVLVIPVAGVGELTGQLKKLDEDHGNIIADAIAANDYKGEKGKFLTVNGGLGALRAVVLIGVGDPADASKTVKEEKDISALGGKLYSYLDHAKLDDVTLLVEYEIGGFAPEFVAAHLAYGVFLKSYRFNRYFTKKLEDKKPAFTMLCVRLAGHSGAEKQYRALKAIADGVFVARDLVSEPPNILYPASYADRVKEMMKPLGVKVEVLGEKEMQKLGMGSLLCVGQGSEKESKLVVMQWNNAGKSQPVAFVGKGVCFDTGGISIKPSNGMEDMKYDMGGSASVVGAMVALAGRKAKVNAIGVIGLVENMPSGSAVRPSDVVTSMSGQTIEVLNTDAEGRLVLADALWYCQDRFKPRFMIDLATLTGAIVVTLGQHRAGIFTNEQDLADRLFEAGEQVDERVWQLPQGEEYDKQIDSKIADVQNISNTKGGGSITAAQFLCRFVNDVPWTHIDIAGVAWAEKAKDVTPAGASGYGVRLLDRLIANHYEG